MSTSEEQQAETKRRGRPRRGPAPTGLVRRNLLVDPQALERLRALYHTTSDSEAVRQAVAQTLLAAELEDIVERIAEQGGPLDVYGRTTGVPRLPVHLRPEDIDDADKI